jgi:heparin binding hemagglutinin HbhA
MTEQTKTRFPAPLYAAAGAGDLAYQQLRKLPAVVSELSDKATASLKAANEQAGTRAGALRSTDFDQLRDTAATSAVTFAQLASERALSLYTALVARGERVVGTGVVEAADVINADIETTDVETAEPKAVEATPATVKPTPKPRKRVTKPAAE